MTAPVQVIYARGRNLGALLIRWFPESATHRWSHAGVLIGDRVWEARFGHGFGPTPINEFLSRYHTTEVVRYEVPDPDQGMQWLESHRGMDYATWTVIGMLFDLGNSQQGDQCSEAVENYLHACGLRRWRSPLHLIKPNAAYNNLHGVI